MGALIASACDSTVDQALHEVLDVGTAPIALCMHCCIENCPDIVAVRCEQSSMLGCMMQQHNSCLQTEYAYVTGR